MNNWTNKQVVTVKFYVCQLLIFLQWLQVIHKLDSTDFMFFKSKNMII